MNTFTQNRYNMGHTQPMPWKRNTTTRRPQGLNINKNNYYGSPWTPQASPGSENYWCETCDKGFMTSNLLENHKLQHQVRRRLRQ